MLDGHSFSSTAVVRGVAECRYCDRGKRIMDVALALLLLVPLCLVALGLLIVNPIGNRGPLLFRHQRMGRDCAPFIALKFRTMHATSVGGRGAFAPLEAARITALGRILRRFRLDELPQIINVLRGEMSMIGPRPDGYAHALTYLRTVPAYRMRYQVLPGISGLAQTEVGYVDTIAGLRRKVALDLHYLDRMSLRMDLWIIWRTCIVVLRGAGC